MGGALYLFVRGIDEPGHGMHHDLPPRALIERLDDLLAGRAAPVPA
jgi:exodeoxyribonuclease V beta subunit